MFLWIYSYNFFFVVLLGEWFDGYGGFGVGVIGFVVVGEFV